MHGTGASSLWCHLQGRQAQRSRRPDRATVTEQPIKHMRQDPKFSPLAVKASFLGFIWEEPFDTQPEKPMLSLQEHIWKVPRLVVPELYQISHKKLAVLLTPTFSLSHNRVPPSTFFPAGMPSPQSLTSYKYCIPSLSAQVKCHLIPKVSSNLI